MLTLRKIRNVRADLRGSMTYGQIADLAQITDLELAVIRYSPRLANGGGGPLSASDPASHRPHADRDCNAHGCRGAAPDARVGMEL